MRSLCVVLLISVFYLSIIGWGWQRPLAKKNNEGVKLYKEGKVDDALSKWRDAQIDNPEREELHYNIGSALYDQKKYEDAFNEYEKSLNSKDAELHAKTYYNIGNSFYRMNKLLEAIEYYKKALDINPDDKDAKYNIEFARKKIKENLQKQESKQTQSQEQGGKEQKEGQVEKEKKGRQEAQAGEEEKKEEEKKQEESAMKEQRKNQEGKEGEMSKEDALRLLDALKDDEKDLQKELRTQPGEGRYRVEKDW